MTGRDAPISLGVYRGRYRRFGEFSCCTDVGCREVKLLGTGSYHGRALQEGEVGHIGGMYSSMYDIWNELPVRFRSQPGNLGMPYEKLALSEDPFKETEHGSAPLHGGLMLRAEGKIEAALEAFRSAEQVSNLHARPAPARIERGVTLRALGRPEEALEVLASVGRDFPGKHPSINARALMEEGRTFRGMGRLQEALEIFSVAERHGLCRGKGAEARIERALVLREVDRHDEALEVLASVDRDFGEERGFRYHCAQSVLLAGVYAEGPDALKGFLARPPGHWHSHRGYAIAPYLLGEMGEDEFDGFLMDWWWWADMEYWKGEKALREGRRDEAATRFARAVELNIPGNTWPLFEARLRLKELKADRA